MVERERLRPDLAAQRGKREAGTLTSRLADARRAGNARQRHEGHRDAAQASPRVRRAVRVAHEQLAGDSAVQRHGLSGAGAIRPRRPLHAGRPSLMRAPVVRQGF